MEAHIDAINTSVDEHRYIIKRNREDIDALKELVSACRLGGDAEITEIKEDISEVRAATDKFMETMGHFTEYIEVMRHRTWFWKQFNKFVDFLGRIGKTIVIWVSIIVGGFVAVKELVMPIFNWIKHHL